MRGNVSTSRILYIDIYTYTYIYISFSLDEILKSTDY